MRPATQVESVFARPNAFALPLLPQLVRQWLPDGRRRGVEWVAPNPRRADRRPGSFSINLVKGVLRLSADAHLMWEEFRNRIEAGCAPSGEFAEVRDFASKTAEHAARLAGVLQIMRDPDSVEISREAMQYGMRLAEWYLREALRLATLYRIDPQLPLAMQLMRWLPETALSKRPEGACPAEVVSPSTSAEQTRSTKGGAFSRTRSQ